MRIFSEETRAARAELRAARLELDRLMRHGIAEDSPHVCKAYHRVEVATAALPRWKRLDIDHTVG